MARFNKYGLSLDRGLGAPLIFHDLLEAGKKSSHLQSSSDFRGVNQTTMYPRHKKDVMIANIYSGSPL